MVHQVYGIIETLCNFIRFKKKHLKQIQRIITQEKWKNRIKIFFYRFDVAYKTKRIINSVKKKPFFGVTKQTIV